MERLLSPWPWYLCGPMLGIIMTVLLYFGKTFGMSSNLKTLCTIGGADKYADFFKIKWREYIWNLIFAFGGIIGGFIAFFFLSKNVNSVLNPKTIKELELIGFDQPGKMLVPQEIYSLDSILTIKGALLLIIGGFIVGFGSRYAGGCTSGHAITGLSSLQFPSLIAVIGFMIGGIIMVNLILPNIF